MDDDIFRNDHTAQDDFPGFIHRFNLIFGNFGRIFPIQGVLRNKDIFLLLTGFQRIHGDGLDGGDMG